MGVTPADYWNVALAVIASLGGGALVVIACATWLGKVWAARILEQDRVRYQTELESLKEAIAKRVHEYNVAASRLDVQRSEAIQNLYGVLVDWFEVAISIMAPNQRLHENPGKAVLQYYEWGQQLRAKTERLEKLAMLYAIFFTEESYTVLARCGFTASTLSIDFLAAVNKDYDTWDSALKAIEHARRSMQERAEKDFKPAREMLIGEFRALVNPTIRAARS